MDLALTFDAAELAPQRQRLDNRPAYTALRNLAELRYFMAHAICAVRELMSVVNYLQNEIAPARYPWPPRRPPAARRLPNQWALAEESDIGLPAAAGNAVYDSHVELYCGAMREIDADPAPALKFVDIAAASGLAPLAPHCFMEHTRHGLDSGQPSEEAIHTAREVREVRIRFWDGVLNAIGRKSRGTP
ncbi:MAG TPA: hypothetical protein DEP05_05755 [Betaproteobacteria bacterium]|nr:hypothetical protein [Betaproteobacteria bacterium]